MIDLHIHSSASDGSLSPSEIVLHAHGTGLSAIAITDHDTIDGVREAVESGIPHPMEFITGVEISAHPPDEYADAGSLHILGYGFSIYDRDMTQTLEKLREARALRNPEIIEKLNLLGFPITMQGVCRICGQGQMGRPHIAMAMVENGYVSSFDEAFDIYLGSGKPAYVDKFRLSAREAIELIIEAGGVPILAHPGIIKGTATENLISRLMAMGLAGIEVYHTDHTPEQTLFFEKLARKKGILMTGGSDFHGIMKPEILMGKGTGNLNIDHEIYKTLCLHIENKRQENHAIGKLEASLQYHFKNRSLLYNALYHSSYVNELHNPDITDNQRLEFLGDAVLGLAVGHILMEKFPDMKEGELSKIRASLVSEPGLAAMARRMDMGRFICLGKGERLSRGSDKNSILADTFEAVIAAIYLEHGFEGTYRLIAGYFELQISQITKRNETEDYKSMLQEVVQEMGDFTPCYTVSGESGPDHEKTFEVTLNVYGLETRGEGKNKKSAEQSAASKALEFLKNLEKTA
ncbi:MAG: ribonuclease III [Desulfamplus sp.]|nr:ribonuclease III [Desulfamplus sp.]